MGQKIKRTITEVLNCETGECIDANEFFKKPLDEIHIYRSQLQQAIQKIRDPLFTCYYCKQKIRIRGGITFSHKKKSEIFHFAHLKDSDECPIKTNNDYSKEDIDAIKYNGAKESELHRKLKVRISECLKKNKEISSIEIEKIVRDKVVKEWKKPDINALFRNERIAFEIQLSTTWLDVITKRQHFYKEQGIYILWVFHIFNINDDVRKLTYNDVIYTNNQNAYVFDDETYKLSILENDLVLKCIYKIYYQNEQELGERWEESLIRLSDLTFDEDKFSIYYHDTDTQKKNIDQEIENHTRNIQEQERKLRELKYQIKDFTNEIAKVKETKYGIILKEQEGYAKLNEKKEIITNVLSYVEMIVKHSLKGDVYDTVFFANYNLLNSLSKKNTKTLQAATQIISDNKKEQSELTNNLLGIGKVSIVEIFGKTYSSIDHTIYWDYIKQNYSKIKIITKNSVNELFAESEMKTIKTEYDLNHLQYSKDILFLIDFSPKIAELTEKIKINQKNITQQEILIAAIRNQIKEKLEISLQEEIIEIETELKNYTDIHTKLDDELTNRENELKSIEQTIGSPKEIIYNED